MFSRLFGRELPEVTPEQDRFELIPNEIQSDSEITASAFEPRFKLLALGNAIGRIYIINSNHEIMASDQATGTPICNLIACPNTSSFVSIFSPSLFKDHPCKTISYQDGAYPEGWTTLSSSKTSGNSIICHWAVTPDKIIARPVGVRQNIACMAVSPSSPNFALCSLADGSIHGFSFESMSFTELYIDAFVNKPLHCLYCARSLKYYICTETVEILDIKTLELDTYSKSRLRSIDLRDEIAATIGEDGIPRLMKGNRVIKEVPLDGGHAVFASLLTGEDWICCIRRYDGDTLYHNGNALPQKFRGVVGSLLVEYGSFFTREHPVRAIIALSNGSLVSIKDQICDVIKLFPPFIKSEFCVLTKSNEAAAFVNEGGDLHLHIVGRKTYSDRGIVNINPIGVINGRLIGTRDKSIISFDPSTGKEESKEFQETSLIYTDSTQVVVAHKVIEKITQPNEGDEKEEEKQNTEESKQQNIDVSSTQEVPQHNTEAPSTGEDQAPAEEENPTEIKECQNNEQKENEEPKTVEETEKENGKENKEIERIEFLSADASLDFHPIGPFELPQGAAHYRIVGGEPAIVFNDGTVCYKGKKSSTKLSPKDGNLVLLEAVGIDGRTSKDGQFLLAVAAKRVVLFDLDVNANMKSARSMSLRFPVTAACVLDAGLLLVVNDNNADILPLPDFTLKCLGSLTLIDSTLNIASHGGLLSSSGLTTSLYIPFDSPKPLFDETAPPLVVPVEKKLFGLVKEKPPTTEEVDGSFGYKRTNKVSSNISETTQLMQEILVVAQQRADALRELEDKADRIREHARQFREAARKFRR